MKKKIVHTRIPEDLFDEIVTKAKKNRTTVSSLIRNLVEDFLDITEDLTDLASGKVRKVLFSDEAKKPVGHTLITLLHEEQCADCEKSFKKNAVLHLVHFAGSAKTELMCDECLQKINRGK